jgi:hypothetical protein
MKVNGKSGSLFFRYQKAVNLGAWTIEPVTGTSGNRFRLSASVESLVEPWCNERPLDVKLDFGNAQWLWEHVDPKTTAPTITMELENAPTIIKERVNG